tara:strand:+ start:3746 stop:4237 length:492 start_codon:yes stop_codon:yes gene_type:complete
MKKVTQKNKVKEHLNSGQSITPIEALERYGCFRLAAIIHTLKHQNGMNIKTEMIKNKFGTKYGKYKLVKIPEDVNYHRIYNNIKSKDEEKVSLLLKIYGYESVVFKYSISQESRYIRIGYWKRISKEDLAQTHINSNLYLEEISIYDDDCGYKYWYNISQKQV